MQWAWIRNFSALLALLGEIYCNALEGRLSGEASLLVLAYFRTISSSSANLTKVFQQIFSRSGKS